MATSLPASAWSLTPGDKIIRKDFHRVYGGRTQGGVSPSRSSPNVILFSDPKSGVKHGYIDGWQSDGCFHYTGEGQRGDQEIKSGNAAIALHQAQGRDLRLFSGTGGLVEYVGRFAVEETQPFYTTEAPETGGGPTRLVIVFRLKPLDGLQAGLTKRGDQALPTITVVSDVPLEENQAERFFVDPSRPPYEAERREAKLVRAFCTHLKGMGLKPTRLRIQPAGEAKPLFCDILVKDIGLLVEAKGTCERGSIRTAIGQLFDYGRFANLKSRALLLPSRPRNDLIDLAQSVGAGIFFPTGGGFSYLAGADGINPLPVKGTSEPHDPLR